MRMFNRMVLEAASDSPSTEHSPTISAKAAASELEGTPSSSTI